MKPTTVFTALLALLLGVCLSACGGSSDGDGADTDGTGSGTAGTSVATPPASGNGNGGGNGSGPPCPLGSDGCPCSASDYCDFGLVCEEGVCGDAAAVDDTGTSTDTGTGTAGTTDATGSTGDSGGSTDGSTDGSTGNGSTGNGKNACAGDEFIEILAVDADTIIGWDEVMSGIGEGQILSHDDAVPQASVQWNLDIPCDDDWHIWVRAIDFADQDSFFVQVDDGPMPIPIFEVDCTDDPQMQAEYTWRELNWREQDAKRCDYVEDPWVQENWQAGPHTFTLGYEPGQAYALSRIWLTNTQDLPPE